MNKIKKSNLFLICNLLFIIGISAGFLIKTKPFYLYIIFLVLLIFLTFFYKKISIKIILLGLCFLIFGIWRYNVGLPKIDKSHIAFYNNNEKIEFIGIVNKEPDLRIDHVKLTVKAVEVAVEAKPPDWRLSLHGNVLIKTKLFPEFAYGDKLEINCKLQTPESFNDFAYDKYLARYDIYSVCYYPKIILLKRDQANKFYAGVYKFKNRLKLIIAQSLPEPHSSLLSAIILGLKRGMPKELTENFSKTGVSHVAAISGMHISILAMILLYLGIIFGLRRDQSFYFSSIVLFLYITLIGFPASAVRAGIMGFLVLLAIRLGRLGKIINSILFAAALMLLINPFLIYDVGFQLSFLAILGLIYILPIFEKLEEKIPASWKFKNFFKSFLALILITVSAQITTLPLILYHFGRLSLIAPIANILIVPLMPFIMILGLLLLSAGLIWINLAQAIGWILWLVLTYLIYVVNFLSKFNFSSFDIKINWQVMLAFFVVILFFVLVKKRKGPAKK